MVKNVTLTLAQLSNRALLCAAIIRSITDSAMRKDNVILKDNYYLMLNVKGMDDESAIDWLENVESIISQLYLCDSTLKGEKRKEKLAWLATMIREQYKENRKIPAWVNPLLAIGNLDSYSPVMTTDKKTRRKTNTESTIEPIGASVVTGKTPYAVESPKTAPTQGIKGNNVSPVTPKTNYRIGDVVTLRAGSVSRDGSEQAFTTEDMILGDVVSLRAKKQFSLNDIPNVVWTVTRVDLDTDKIWATWSTKTPVVKSTKTTKTQPTKTPKESYNDSVLSTALESMDSESLKALLIKALTK